jgi:hypothetical protein
MPDGFRIYGFPEECQKFDERHPLWNEVSANLERALNLAFTRVQTMSLLRVWSPESSMLSNEEPNANEAPASRA